MSCVVPTLNVNRKCTADVQYRAVVTARERVFGNHKSKIAAAKGLLIHEEVRERVRFSENESVISHYASLCGASLFEDCKD
jgi:hypothetical protein